MQQLAAAPEKYEGVVFTDMNGNILTDQLVEDMDTESATTNEQWPTGVEHKDKRNATSAYQQPAGVNYNAHFDEWGTDIINGDTGDMENNGPKTTSDYTQNEDSTSIQDDNEENAG